MTKRSRFVLLRHVALRAGDHFDLRFEKEKDIWDSFAIRKGLPLNLGEKRLVIRTTIHSEKEALFTGKIESGYGAGELKLFDSGQCEIIKYQKNHMVVIFHGKKIKGLYHFIEMASIGRGKENQYLTFKGKADEQRYK